MAKPTVPPMQVIEERGYLESHIRRRPFQCRRRRRPPGPRAPSVRMETTHTLRVGLLSKACFLFLNRLGLRSRRQAGTMSAIGLMGSAYSDLHVRAPNEGAGRQPRKKSGPRARCKQRLPSSPATCVRLAREHEPATTGRAASGGGGTQRASPFRRTRRRRTAPERRRIQMAIQRTDTVTSTVHFQTPNWTASSTPRATDRVVPSACS